MRSTRHAVIAIGLVLALLVPNWSVASAQSSGQNEPPQRYIVQLVPAAGVDQLIAQALDPRASTVLQKYSSVINGFAVELPPQAAQALARNPLVLNVMQDPVVQTSAQTTPTGITRIGALSNPDAKIDGIDERVNINVAVIDTGSGPHADLNVVGGVDCTGSGTYNDQNGHGTHVAGTIGALDNDSGVVGVAPGARIWSVKVLDAQGSGYGSWILCGIDWISKNLSTTNIKIANMSLGGVASVADDGNCGKTLRDSIHQAICNSVAAGVTYTVAAGNDGKDAAGYFPAMYDEVITVSALVDTDGKPGGLGAGTSAGADDTLASFSNFGADVDVIAPGVNILSTVPGGYASYSSTSMASPHAAGAAALYLVANPSSSPAQVRNGLMSTGSSSAWSGDRDSSKEPLIDVSLYRGITPPPTEPDPLPALIDAETVSISAPSGVTQGGTATVSASVRNNGAVAATVNVTFSESPGGANESTNVNLAAGASATVNFNWVTTTSTATGNHTVTVSAALANDSNAGNNAKSRTIAVSAPVTRDAEVTSISAPSSVTRGNSVTVSAGVRNNGSASETISVIFNESPGGASQTKSVTLGPGASTTVSFSWATTTSTATGTHTLKATASLANDTNAGNNAKSRSITVSAPTTSTKSMSVSNITLSSTKTSNGARISSRVYIKSGSAVISGAKVTIRYTDPNGATLTSSASTNSSGYASFSRSITRKGTYSVQVTGVTKSGYSYSS
nr:S8 family serine peptidase [Chloroflexia bacterium]